MSSTTSTMKLTKPDVNDKVSDTISALAANFDIIDKLYPVGSIYMSTKSTNPSSFIGGTWTAITERFLVGSGTNFPAGSTGGQADMGIHKSGDEDGGTHTLYDGSGGFGGRVMVSGSSYSGKILPPYKSVYMWERTA